MLNKLIVMMLLLATQAKAEVKETDYRQMTGVKNVLVVRVQFPDYPAGNTYAEIESAVNTAASLTNKKSYGRLSLTYDITPLLTLPRPTGYYNKPLLTKEELLRVDAVALAQTAGYAISPSDYQGYDRVVVRLSNGYNFNQRYYHTVFVSNPIPTAIIHELGHSWLFAHAGLWQVNDGNPLSPNGYNVEYGDPFDVMAQSYATIYDQLDYNMFFKYYAGWIDDGQVAVSDQSGTYIYTINRFDNEDATGMLAIRVSAGNDYDYWIGYRRNFISCGDARKTMAHGAYIIRAPKAPDFSVLANDPKNRTSLIDTQTAGVNPNNAALPLNKSLVDDVNGLTITPLAEGGTPPHEWLTVRVTRQ